MVPQLRILLILLSSLFIYGTALADDPPEIVSQGESLLHVPEGKTAATFQRENRVRILGREGDWVRVQLEGYIWRPSVEKVVLQAPPVEDIPVIPVQLQDYRIQWVPQDLKRNSPTKRAHVKARFSFRNNMPSEIACLRYRIQLYNLRGQTLHQESVDCESGDTRSSGITYDQDVLWKEFNGARGDIYRRLEKAAKQGTIRLDLALLEAFFIDGTSTRFGNP